ncbi:MAG: hypothetical protein PVJ04_08095 [Gemmatimonadota bacterium]
MESYAVQGFSGPLKALLFRPYGWAADGEGVLPLEEEVATRGHAADPVPPGGDAVLEEM